MKHNAYGFTAVGQVRHNNEDAHLLAPQLNLYVVCDGMGGRAAGEVASSKACELLHREIEKRQAVFEAYRDFPDAKHRQDAQTEMREAISEASRVIYELGLNNPELHGMATTVVAMLVCGKNALIAHAGDSRAYLIRELSAYLLTEDHSLVTRQLQRGLITPEDALHSSKSHVITRAIGLHEEIEAVTLNIELMPGDVFLLCSDGLSRYVTTEEIGKAGSRLTPGVIPEKLVRLADERSGKDNITAVTVDIDTDQEVEGLSAAEKIDALRQIPLFQNLSYKEAIRVLSIVSSRTYAPGDQIFVQGEAGEEFYVAVAGTFRVVMDGQELTQLHAGTFFGEMALLSEEPRMVDVYAIEISRVLVISREDMFTLLRGEPYLATKFLWSFCRVLSDRTMKIGKELAMAKYAADQNGEPEVTEPFDLSAVAHEVEQAVKRRAARMNR